MQGAGFVKYRGRGWDYLSSRFHLPPRPRPAASAGLAGTRSTRREPPLHLHRDRGAHARTEEGGGRAGMGPVGPASPRRRWGSGIRVGRTALRWDALGCGRRGHQTPL